MNEYSDTNTHSTLCPQLVIHCGVDGSADKIRIEKYAYNSNYCKPDWSGKCLDEPKVCLKNNGTDCDALTTCIDVEKMVNELNAKIPNEMFVCSSKVGKLVFLTFVVCSVKVKNFSKLILAICVDIFT